jgi:hypothetical protein
MTTYRKIARASAACWAAALLGATAAGAQPLNGSDDGTQWQRALNTRSEALNAQYGLGGTGAEITSDNVLGPRRSLGSKADLFTACRTVGAPISLERFLCYRRAANLANEQLVRPAPLTRPIVIDGTGFDWADAGVGFATATGLVLLGAGSAVAVRSR